MTLKRLLLPAILCLAFAVLVPNALAASQFHPRVGPALGIVPPVNKQGEDFSPDIASGAVDQVLYHDGPVMNGGVTIHTIFWAPSGFTFQAGYETLIKQFFGDVAADAGELEHLLGAQPIRDGTHP